MSISRRAAAGASAIALAASGFLTMGAAAPAIAKGHHHHHHHHCHGKYPPGKCKVFVKHHKRHHGQEVKFRTGRAFKPGETVNEKLVCPPDYSKNVGSTTATKHGVATDSFRVPSGASGSCNLVLTGQKSGTRVSTPIQVTGGKNS